MTKIVTTEITRCNQCPYVLLSLKDYCLHGDKPKKLNTVQWIPSWCPLHDKEENSFMKWLDSMIEDIECDDSLDLYSTPSHEYHTKQGILRGLRMVEDKVKGLGLNNKQTGYD